MNEQLAFSSSEFLYATDAFEQLAYNKQLKDAYKSIYFQLGMVELNKRKRMLRQLNNSQGEFISNEKDHQTIENKWLREFYRTTITKKQMPDEKNNHFKKYMYSNVMENKNKKMIKNTKESDSSINHEQTPSQIENIEYYSQSEIKFQQKSEESSTSLQV